MDDAPSTSTRRIYDYEDIEWAENRSKMPHDPLIMAKIKVGKLKKDGPSSSKAQNACTNIQPTPEELALLDLPGNMSVSYFEHSTSTAKPTQAILEDVPGFEDFSSKPPDQFLRRTRCVSRTSSTPPSKRKKKVNLVKQKSSPMEQLEQSPVIQKESFSIPESSDNVFDLHGLSSDPKEKKNITDIEEIKQYLKEYVSESHNYY
ncbi:hypothetical protein RDI58_010034 [Solanum bulbocastanum]|uniref:Ulp1 protease family, C-terminal catalytic domain containing protein n=1 Tax=Solanum bulbocastanum TaxID=147425 RepID=A0AAN8TM33_SOLBU